MKFNYELPKVDARFSPDKVESKVKTFSEISKKVLKEEDRNLG